MRALRAITWERFPACLTCEDAGYCKMCMARNFNESNGDLFALSRRCCTTAAINRREVEAWQAAHAGDAESVRLAVVADE